MGDAAAQERRSRSQPKRERAGMRVHLGVRRSKPPLGSPLPADLPKGLASTIAVFAFRLTRLRTPYVPHTTAGSCSLCLLSECCLWPSSRRGETQEDAGCTSFRRWGRKWGQGREFLYQTHVVKLLREPNGKLVVNANSVEGYQTNAGFFCGGDKHSKFAWK